MKEILLIEQDRGLSDGIVLGMLQGPYRITQNYSVEEARKSIRSRMFSLIIVSLKLPDGSGASLLKQIRRNAKTSVIILTEKNTDPEELTEYIRDTDVCIAKPFSLTQLKSKVEMICKRQKKEPEREYRFKTVSFQAGGGRIYRATQEVCLDSTEKKLLQILIENQGEAMSEIILIRQVWNDCEDGKAGDRLAGAIRSLRNKLEEDPERPELIRTVSGKGYSFGPPDGIIVHNPA